MNRKIKLLGSISGLALIASIPIHNLVSTIPTILKYGFPEKIYMESQFSVNPIFLFDSNKDNNPEIAQENFIACGLTPGSPCYLIAGKVRRPNQQEIAYFQR